MNSYSSYGTYGAYGAPTAAPPTTTTGSTSLVGQVMQGVMMTADKFTQTTDILTMLLMLYGMASMTMSGRRRRRDTQSQELPSGETDNITTDEAFKIMNKFDEEDCIGLLVCSIASQTLQNRTREQAIVLETMKLDKMSPLSWPSVCQNPMGKYQLAIQMGNLSQTRPKDGICGNTFSKCKLTPKELMDTIRIAAERTFGETVES
ncbi:UNVERIFIED_CONTAM: hypothetical protein RMT77_001270 [Armadillidium vulgare]